MINLAQGQNPLAKQWDYRFGGPFVDYLTCFQQTKDYGFILGGFSTSGIGGDKTQPNLGFNDYWVVKLDSTGAKLWDKNFGGTSSDRLSSIQQTSDGGYILGGWSLSGIGGDKTQANWGNEDYWVIKIDSLGIKQWDKNFGGTNSDLLYSLQQTSDGGYILGGYSNSGISGDKTQSVWGGINPDYWIVKIDSTGAKQWDKNFGGSETDELISMQQTTDDGYILGGFSYSGISGDKTQPLWSPNNCDYWILKTDSLGTKEWDKDIGGTKGDLLYALKQTNDKGYILGGFSNSGVSGHKTEPLWGGSADIDYWLVKTDSLGNFQWDKDLGGTSNDNIFNTITQTQDNGYLNGGVSFSNISGDKSEDNLGVTQSWIIKIDSLGMKQWDKTLRTLPVINNDGVGLSIQLHDGCFAMANSTSSNIAGDKSQPNQGDMDYWIVKFCDTTLTTYVNTSINHISNLTICPNPFNTSFSISLLQNNVEQVIINVHNIIGQSIYKEIEYNPVYSFSKTIDLNFLEKGMYVVEVIVDGEKTIKKIVKW